MVTRNVKNSRPMQSTYYFIVDNTISQIYVYSTIEQLNLLVKKICQLLLKMKFDDLRSLLANNVFFSKIF